MTCLQRPTGRVWLWRIEIEEENLLEETTIQVGARLIEDRPQGKEMEAPIEVIPSPLDRLTPAAIAIDLDPAVAPTPSVLAIIDLEAVQDLLSHEEVVPLPLEVAMEEAAIRFPLAILEVGEETILSALVMTGLQEVIILSPLIEEGLATVGMCLETVGLEEVLVAHFLHLLHQGLDLVVEEGTIHLALIDLAPVVSSNPQAILPQASSSPLLQAPVPMSLETDRAQVHLAIHLGELESAQLIPVHKK
jgi:hypothetical protein